MTFYNLPQFSYIVDQKNHYLIHDFHKGALCKISARTKTLIERVALQKNILDKLGKEEQAIIKMLIDNKILYPVESQGTVKQLDNIDEMYKRHVTWFKNVTFIIVKVTNRCNINCPYCYERANVQGKDMSLKAFSRLARAVLTSTNASRVKFLFHGGEPTLLSTEWYQSSLSYLKELAKEFSKGISTNLQSNLVDIPREKLELFKKFNVIISGSIDNPTNPEMSMRPKTEKTIHTLLTAKSMGVPVGILLNINRSNMHEMSNICAWLANNLQKKIFKANVVYPVGSGERMESLTAMEIFNAQKDILTYMIDTQGKSILERNICEELERFFESHLGGKKRKIELCHSLYCGAGRNALAVEPNGNILLCGRFSSNEKEWVLGSLDSYYDLDDTGRLLFDKKVCAFHQLNQEIWEPCAACSAKAICSFGCRAFVSRLNNPVNIECQPTLYRLDFYSQNQSVLKPVYEAYKNLMDKRKKSSL